MATTVPVAIYLIAVGAAACGPRAAADHAVGVAIAAVLVLADSFMPAPLYITAGVLAVLVAVLTVATRTRAATDEQPASSH